MDKALTCHPDGQGSNPGQAKEIFLFEKIQKCAPILLGTPPCELSLSQYLSSHAPALILVTGEVKREES